METATIVLFIFGALLLYFLMGIRIVRPTERGVIETLGKYSSYAEPGANYIFPIFQRLYKVNTKEQLVPTEKQLIITKDKLNAEVNAQVYFRVGRTEDDVKCALYNPEDYEYQIVQIAKTTLRNIIGTMTLTDANSGRNAINSALMEALVRETANWGITIVRTELAEIDPPKDVQATMNKVVIAENEKIAAADFALAAEIKADGLRKAAIKEAEGVKQAAILAAQGQAESIKLINNSAKEHFVGNAVLLKQLEVTQASLQDNTKVVITEKGTNLQMLIGDANIVPIKEVKTK